MHASVVIGRKLLATSYAIIKTGQPYDPAHRLFCLRSPLASHLTSV